MLSLLYTGIPNVIADYYTSRKVRRYQSGKQKPPIEEGQTTQWPKEKGQKDKQRPTRHHTKK
jgi:hypothetical protein